MSEPEKLWQPKTGGEALGAARRIANYELGERSIRPERHHLGFDEPTPPLTIRHSDTGGEAYFIIIGVAVVLIAFFGHVALLKDSQLSSTTALLSAEKARNIELQKKVDSLEQEVTALKETADYYFQKGVDQQSAGNLYEARTAFETVVTKFPTSNLVGSAQQRLTAVNAAFAKAEAGSRR
ncbi:MAG: hypothetical protein ABSF71_32210 [Terriglobia bacterium]|jgi:hypothetical protein